MNLKKIPVGKNPPEEVNVFIEVSQDGSVKYELDEESGVIFVDRFLYPAMSYPFNYGFIPNTMGGDGDHLDVLVISSKAVDIGVVIPVKPVGMLETEDEKGIDHKVIGVPLEKVDPEFAEVNDISDISEATKNKIRHFFENYKTLEPAKWVKVKGWKGKREALEVVKKAL